MRDNYIKDITNLLATTKGGNYRWYIIYIYNNNNYNNNNIYIYILYTSEWIVLYHK